MFLSKAEVCPLSGTCHHQTFAKACDELSAASQPKRTYASWHMSMGLSQ
jgi:hypothetical protein